MIHVLRFLTKQPKILKLWHKILFSSFLARGAGFVRLSLSVCVLSFLAGCSQAIETTSSSNAANSPLPKETRDLLVKKGMRISAPIFIRIFKKESELEIWKQKDDGLFYYLKTYPICNWSGKLGPKLKQGDKQAPEGFYKVSRGQMNPNSKFHLSFNLGYPNAYDRSFKRTGANLMVHGDCSSAGCYAMTDALVEEIYAFAREAFDGGQEFFYVHAYPFRMTSKNMALHKRSRWMKFWLDLKKGYDQFELARVPPKIRVCEKRYQVNPAFADFSYQINPAGPCPGSPGFRPMRRAPDLTIARSQRQRRQGDPLSQIIETRRQESAQEKHDPGFDSLSLPDDIFSDDLGGLRDGVY